MLIGLVGLVGLLLYFLPTIIAASRSKRNTLAICALNLLLGWTALGWIVSLVWALTAEAPGAESKPHSSADAPVNATLRTLMKASGWNCPETITKQTVLLWVGVILLGLILVLGGIIDAIMQASPTSSAPAGPPRPGIETAFLASKMAVESRFDAAPNDMAKHRIAKAWKNGGTCAALKTTTFTDWVGTINTISYDGNFIVDLGDGVTLDGTVESHSPQGRAVAKMQEGDTVIVSGQFHPDALVQALNMAFTGNAYTCKAHPTNTFDAGSVRHPSFDVTYSRIVDMTRPSAGQSYAGDPPWMARCAAYWADQRSCPSRKTR